LYLHLCCAYPIGNCAIITVELHGRSKPGNNLIQYSCETTRADAEDNSTISIMLCWIKRQLLKYTDICTGPEMINHEKKKK